MIRIKGLTKDYEGNRALKGVDMNVKKGSIYGLIGTNGAGKTTILRILNGVIKADSGSVEIDGMPVYDNVALKEKIAYVPDDLCFFNSYNLNDARNYYSSIYKRWDESIYKELVSLFNLDPKTEIRKFSKGMQKQAVFALVMATMPEYLILDEPIDGLDPIVRQTLWKYIIAAVADREMTTLVSSHNLREMEGYCDSIGVIDEGVMKVERDLDELKSGIHKIQVSFGQKNEDKPESYSNLKVLNRQSSGSVDILIVRNDIEALEQFKKKYSPVLFDVVPLTLEEVFIYELGGGNDEVQIIG